MGVGDWDYGVCEGWLILGEGLEGWWGGSVLKASPGRGGGETVVMMDFLRAC